MSPAEAIARLPLGLRARSARSQPSSASAATAGLVFHERGGPLLAVCGLTGGAGTSTLAYLLAAQAAAESSVPILLCEGDATAGALALLAGATSPLTLSDLTAHALAGTRPPEAPYAVLADELRLVAGAPQPPPTGGEPLNTVLQHAREAHGLAIIDAGTVNQPGAATALETASHVLWVLPATTHGAERARALWNAGAGGPADTPRETVAAINTQPRARVPVSHLNALAATRAERLVLVPNEPALASGGPTPTALLHTLADLASAVRRHDGVRSPA